MKTVMLLIASICSLYASAQIMHKVIVSPNNITSTDTVYIETQIAIAGTCSNLDSFSYVNGNSIQINACYLSLETQGSVTGRDTMIFKFISLTEGVYNLKYIVTATNDTSANDCQTYDLRDTTVTTFIVGPNRVLEINNTVFAVTPNPVTNLLTGKMNSITSKARLQVMTLEGRCVIPTTTITQPDFQIDVSSLPAGMYLLQAQDDKQRLVKRFVKK